MSNKRYLRFSVAVCISFALIVCMSTAEPKNTDVEGVSLVSVLANPEKFGDKRVMIVGYIRYEFEHQALYLSRDDAGISNHQNSIWVGTIAEKGFVGEKRLPKRGFVRVIGTVRVVKGGAGHFGLWPAAIEEITLLVKAPKK